MYWLLIHNNSQDLYLQYVKDLLFALFCMLQLVIWREACADLYVPNIFRMVATMMIFEMPKKKIGKGEKVLLSWNKSDEQ